MASRRQVLEGIILALPATLVGRAFAQSHALPREINKLSERTFPRGWQLYESCGQRLFPIHDVTGGLATKQMCWLVRKEGTLWEGLPIVFSDLEQIAVGFDEKALKMLAIYKFIQTISLADPQAFNPDGGLLPMPFDLK